MRLYTTLSEEAERLTRICVFLYAEDLNFHDMVGVECIENRRAKFVRTGAPDNLPQW